MTVARLSNGKIAEGYVNWDAQGLMQQLGVVLSSPSRWPPQGSRSHIPQNTGRPDPPRAFFFVVAVLQCSLFRWSAGALLPLFPTDRDPPSFSSFSGKKATFMGEITCLVVPQPLE